MMERYAALKASVEDVLSNLPVHVCLLSVSCLLGYYNHKGRLATVLLWFVRFVGSLVCGLVSLLTFSFPVRTRMSRVGEVVVRLMQILGTAESDSGVLKELTASREWKEFCAGEEREPPRAGLKSMLVLDLDETLIHSSPERKLLCEPVFLLYDEDQRQHFYVYKRPFVDLFLAVLAPFYDINMFTASFASYSDPILENIDPGRIISKCFTSTSLVETKLYGMQKDLELVSKEHMPKRLIMVDNSPIACMANQENLYVVSSFKANQPFDKELLSLLLLLLIMSDVNDVRSILHRRKTIGESS